MSITFGIEVEHTHYVLLLDPEKNSSGSIDLTTLADNQKKAIINIYLFENRRKILIETIEIAPLPPKPAGKHRIRCTGKLESNRFLRLQVAMEHKNLYSGKIDVKPYRKHTHWWWILLLIIILAGGITAAVLFTGEKRSGKAAEGLLEEQRQSVKSETHEDTQVPEKTADTVRAINDRNIGSGEKTTAGEKADDGKTADDKAAAAEEPALDPGSDEGNAADETEKEEAPQAPVITEEEVSVYFLPESSVLLDETKNRLREIAGEVRPENAGITQIEGHCALYGTEESREWLSRERAENVYSYLNSIGVEFPASPRIRGVGGKDPVTRDRDRQELNRRVEITIKTTKRRE